MLKPQIFEIGRTQAVHLATFGSPTSEFSACNFENILDCQTLEQNYINKIDSAVIYQPAIIVLILLLLSLFAFTPNTTAYIAGGFSFLCFFSLLILSDNFPTHEKGEPFLWLEGISVWPNLVIRIFGIIIILIFFLYSAKKLRDSKTEIESDLESFQIKRVDRSWLKAITQGPFLDLKQENSDIKDSWVEYVKTIDYQRSKGYLWIFCVTAISLALTYYGLFFLGYLNFPSRGGIAQNLHNFIALVQFLILWGLIHWVGYEATACKRFIDQLEPNKPSKDQLNWSPRFVQEQENKKGISSEELEPYFRFLLITRLTKRINSIIHIPFVLMLLIAIGRSNIFDNLGFSPALIMVFLSASAYLITTLFLLRESAEKQCEDILHYYDEYRPGMIASVFGTTNKINLLATEIRDIKQKTFASFLQRPTVLALLLPGGGIG